MSSKKIFRFKFSNDFLPSLVEFARIHQFDKTPEFKEAFETFCDTNKNIIQQETTYLKSIGYEGNIIDKMYKSARYYFKNKNYTPSEKKKRRKYIPQDKEFIITIDEHVSLCMRNDIKPSDSYIEFTTKTELSEILDNEMKRLGEFLDNQKDIVAKIKKTYKNRYFIQQKYVIEKNNDVEC